MSGAVFADVTSANVVGYATKTVPENDYRLVAVPFQAVNGSCQIGDVLKYETDIENDFDTYDFTARAVQAQIMDADGGTKTYYYIKNAWWIDDFVSEEPEVHYDAGWADSLGALCTPEMFAHEYSAGNGTLTPGGSVWVKDPLQVAVMTPAGQLFQNNVGIDCPAAYRLRGNAFPMAFNLNDTNAVKFADMPEAENDFDTYDFVDKAAQIQIQKTGATIGYTTYYYIKNAWWIDDFVSEEPEVHYDAGWADSLGALCTPEMFAHEYSAGDATCPMMNGMWSKSYDSTFHMEFVNPTK